MLRLRRSIFLAKMIPYFYQDSLYFLVFLDDDVCQFIRHLDHFHRLDKRGFLSYGICMDDTAYLVFALDPDGQHFAEIPLRYELVLKQNPFSRIVKIFFECAVNALRQFLFSVRGSPLSASLASSFTSPSASKVSRIICLYDGKGINPV